MKEEKKKIQNSKGITLIVLVVTIIILLILAGVTIAALSGPNGILNNAVEAKRESIIADVIEQVKLDVAEGMADKLGKPLTNGEIETILTKYGNLTDEELLRDKTLEIENGTYKIPVKDILDVKLGVGETSSLTEKDNYADESGDTATIPEGFKVSDKSEEEERDLTTIDTGLVVIGPDESEFVWVPVNDINRMVMCKSKTADDQCNIELNENGTKLICTNHNNSENICGKLYATSFGNSFDSSLKTQTYTPNSGIREPDIVTNYDTGDNLTIVSNIENEFKEMALSVAKYGGFYVSRYEMGLTADNKPVSKNASIVENNVTTADASNSVTRGWYGLYSEAKEYNTNEGVSSSIKSSMIWGSQYDSMMLWMQENGIDVKSDTTPTQTAVRNEDLVTGKEPNDILNNVFDIWGCYYEWTLEAYNTSTRVRRRRILWL